METKIYFIASRTMLRIERYRDEYKHWRAGIEWYRGDRFVYICERKTLNECLDDIIDNFLLINQIDKIKQIIKMRHGLNDGITHTLEEVGREFGVTIERIRQIEAKTEEDIRKILKEYNV